MELRQLRHFLALVEERSITRAAKRELIVQSGLSNSLQALERELGTPLYVRGTRPVRLTAAGEALVGPARRTLTSAAQAEQAVHYTRDVLIGTLRIGVSLSAQHLVPFASYLGEFTRDHPGIDLRLQYAARVDDDLDGRDGRTGLRDRTRGQPGPGRPDDSPGGRAAAPRLPC